MDILIFFSVASYHYLVDNIGLLQDVSYKKRPFKLRISLLTFTVREVSVGRRYLKALFTIFRLHGYPWLLLYFSIFQAVCGMIFREAKAKREDSVTGAPSTP